MASTQCIDEKVGAYCLDYEQGWMTKEQAEQFEREHLAHCQFCVDSLVIMDKSLTVSREHPEFFNSWYEAPEPRSVWHFSTARSYMAAAAMFLFVVAGGVMFYRSYQGSSVRNPYAALASFSMTPDEMDTIRSGGSADLLFEAGVRALGQNQYKKAIEKLEPAARQDPTNPTFNLYYGLALVNIGRYNEAMKAFQVTCDQGEGSLQADGRWYLGNVYLQLNRPSDARALFQLLATYKNRWQDEAQKQLAKIRALDARG